MLREILVSGLREYLAELRIGLPVTKLAKWKTTSQIVALGALILGEAAPGWTMMIGNLEANVPHTVGLITLWTAAALTVITGWDYLRVGLKHMD
jgi:CDP-diacylglycerol--glycerol-3-phosphate 3-phosphatidyltransferase/cardiolipin synthase